MNSRGGPVADLPTAPLRARRRRRRTTRRRASRRGIGDWLSRERGECRLRGRDHTQRGGKHPAACRGNCCAGSGRGPRRTLWIPCGGVRGARAVLTPSAAGRVVTSGCPRRCVLWGPGTSLDPRCPGGLLRQAEGGGPRAYDRVGVSRDGERRGCRGDEHGCQTGGRKVDRSWLRWR